MAPEDRSLTPVSYRFQKDLLCGKESRGDYPGESEAEWPASVTPKQVSKFPGVRSLLASRGKYFYSGRWAHWRRRYFTENVWCSRPQEIKSLYNSDKQIYWAALNYTIRYVIIQQIPDHLWSLNGFRTPLDTHLPWTLHVNLILRDSKCVRYERGIKIIMAASQSESRRYKNIELPQIVSL